MNPNLNPEFSDVFEIGHIKYFDQGSFTLSIYCRMTDGKIEQIRQVGLNRFAVSRSENLLSEYDYGIEFMSSYNPLK